jgi:pimeloyl-ACP methyl ester carboxylesterase
MSAVERCFDVNGYNLAAKEWNSGSAHRVVACHGWLDNAASFDVIAPLLDDVHMIALDMPGHGQSDHKPAQATYNIWDDLLDILAVADEMGWEKFNLIGHSRGAMMCMLLASVMPERVSSLVMLDAFVPQPTAAIDGPKTLRYFIRQNRSAINKKSRGYQSINDAVSTKSKANGITIENAQLLVSRSLKKVDEEYFWSNDPRLLASSAFKMTEEHNKAFINELRSPYLLLLAEDGLTNNQGFKDLIHNTVGLQYTYLPGGHHFHMEEGAVDVARTIINFYDGLAPS